MDWRDNSAGESVCPNWEWERDSTDTVALRSTPYPKEINAKEKCKLILNTNYTCNPSSCEAEAGGQPQVQGWITWQEVERRGREGRLLLRKVKGTSGLLPGSKWGWWEQKLGMSLHTCFPTYCPAGAVQSVASRLTAGTQILKLPGRFQAVSGEALPVPHPLGLILPPLEHLTLILWVNRPFWCPTPSPYHTGSPFFW